MAGIAAAPPFIAASPFAAAPPFVEEASASSEVRPSSFSSLAWSMVSRFSLPNSPCGFRLRPKMSIIRPPALRLVAALISSRISGSPYLAVGVLAGRSCCSRFWRTESTTERQLVVAGVLRRRRLRPLRVRLAGRGASFLPAALGLIASSADPGMDTCGGRVLRSETRPEPAGWHFGSFAASSSSEAQMCPQAAPLANCRHPHTACRIRSSGTLDQSISTVATPFFDGSAGAASPPAGDAGTTARAVVPRTSSFTLPAAKMDLPCSRSSGRKWDALR